MIPDPRGSILNSNKGLKPLAPLAAFFKLCNLRSLSARPGQAEAGGLQGPPALAAGVAGFSLEMG